MLRKLASQIAIYGLSSVLGRLLNWALTPMYVNYFSRGEYGQFSDLYGLILFPFVILAFGMETAFFHFAGHRVRAARAYAHAFATTGLLSLAFWVACAGTHTQLAEMLGYGERPQWILLMASVVVLDVLAAVPMAHLRYREQAAWFAAISLTNILLTLGLNILFVAGLHLGLTWVFAANLIASGLRLGMALLQNLPDLRQLERTAWRPMWAYGVFIMLAGVAGAVNQTLDRVLIPRLWKAGPYQGEWLTASEMNGIYSANYKLTMFILLVTQAFRFAAEPFFFRQAREADAPEIFARIFHYFMVAGMALVLAVSLLGYEIVSFDFFGLTDFTLVPASYWSGLQAVPVVLTANLFLGAYINLSAWFKLSGQVWIGWAISSAGALVTIVMNVLTIPVWGYMGSAWATLACYGLMSVLCYVSGRYYYPIPYRLGRLAVYAAVTLGLYWGVAAVTDLHASGWLPTGLKLAALLLFVGWAAIFERWFPYPGTRHAAEDEPVT